MIYRADHNTINPDLGPTRIVETPPQPTHAGPFELALGDRPNLIAETEGPAVVPVAPELHILVGNAIPHGRVEIQEIALAGRQRIERPGLHGLVRQVERQRLIQFRDQSPFQIRRAEIPQQRRPGRLKSENDRPAQSGYGRGLVGNQRHSPDFHRQPQCDFVAVFPPAEKTGPMVGIERELGFASVDGRVHRLRKPGGDAELQREFVRLLQVQCQPYQVAFREFCVLGYCDRVCLAQPTNHRRYEEIHVEASCIMEIDEVVVIGYGLGPGTGTAGPAEIGVALFAAVRAVVRIIEDASVCGHGDAGADTVNQQALHPVAIARVSGKRDQVFGQLKGRPSATLSFKGVMGRQQLLPQFVPRQQFLIRTEAAGREALLSLKVLVGLLDGVQVYGLSLDQVSRGGAPQGIDMAVSVVNEVAGAIRARSKDVLAAGEEIPIVMILPNLCELAVLGVTRGEISPV